jgi:hypothetical protein
MDCRNGNESLRKICTITREPCRSRVKRDAYGGDLKICGILQSADEMGTFLTQEKIAVMRASRVELFDA